MSGPRFLLDSGVLDYLVCIDSSYGQRAIDGRLALFVNYHRGIPRSVDVVQLLVAKNLIVHAVTSGAISFKVHVGSETS